jgi:hypothetical protein
VFENKVPRRLFGPWRDEVTGGWRKLHNEELQVEDETGGACSTNGEEEYMWDIGGRTRSKEAKK